MKFPFCQTQPAKTVVAFSAVHVHASLVFFDVGVALWTRFTISLDPCKIFRIIFFFFNPKLNKVAFSRQMIFLAAFETESVTTSALDNIIVAVLAFFNNIAASFLRTPLDTFVVISKLLAVPSQILLKIVNFVI
jgi:hypothetical protein